MTVVRAFNQQRVVAEPNDLLELHDLLDGDTTTLPILPPPPRVQFDDRTSRHFMSASPSLVPSDGRFQENEFTVTNSSTKPQAFFWYPSMPAFVSSTTPDKVFVGCYQASLKLDPDSQSTFVVRQLMRTDGSGGQHTPYVFVVTGIAKTTMKTGVKLRPNAAVRLSTSMGDASSLRDSMCIMTKPDGSAPSFSSDRGGKGPPAVKAAPPSSNVPAGFIRIVTDASFDGADSAVPYLGLAMLDPDNATSLVPIISWVAFPSSTVNIQLKNIWNCSRGDAPNGGGPSPGYILNPGDWTNNVEVDFAGTKANQEATFSTTFTLAGT